MGYRQAPGRGPAQDTNSISGTAVSRTWKHLALGALGSFTQYSASGARPGPFQLQGEQHAPVPETYSALSCRDRRWIGVSESLGIGRPAGIVDRQQEYRKIHGGYEPAPRRWPVRKSSSF